MRTPALLVILLAACGEAPAPTPPDAEPVADLGYFRGDGTEYPVLWVEAYAQDVGTADERLIVRGSGRPAGRCDPGEVVACYEVAVTIPPPLSGAHGCATAGTQASVLIDGGTSAAYLAGGAFGTACEFTVIGGAAVGDPVEVAGLVGTLRLVGDTEQTLPVGGGELRAVRGDDR